MPKYKEAIEKHLICSDCVGLLKGYFWTNGGENVIESIGLPTPLFKNSYASNGMPDRSANGMFEYAKSKGMDWGTIDTIPDIPGIAVRYDGHVGVYVGNGEVVEERGFNYGCVLTKLKNRNWLNWYKIPGIKYLTGAQEVTPEMPVLGNRTLRKGMTGEDVRELQKDLNEILHCDLEADGDFGAKTEAAVLKFQKTHNLTADGVYGAQTHTALMSALADCAPDVTEEPQVSIDNGTKYVTTASVNARQGDSTKYSIITTFGRNTELNVVQDKIGEPLVSENGWYAVYCGNQIGWVSDKYVKIG